MYIYIYIDIYRYIYIYTRILRCALEQAESMSATSRRVPRVSRLLSSGDVKHGWSKYCFKRIPSNSNMVITNMCYLLSEGVLMVFC